MKRKPTRKDNTYGLTTMTVIPDEKLVWRSHMGEWQRIMKKLA